MPLVRLNDGDYWYRQLQRREFPLESRFLTCSCRARLALFRNDDIKNAFADRLEHARQLFNFLLIAWVIMPEHFHILLRPDLESATVRQILHNIKGAFARRVIDRWKELDAPILPRLRDGKGVHRFWEVGGGYDRNIFSRDELVEKVNYIHWNPVKRGLVARPTDWAWSSARWYAGDRTGTPVVTRI
jgi:putative transposase